MVSTATESLSAAREIFGEISERYEAARAVFATEYSQWSRVKQARIDERQALGESISWHRMRLEGARDAQFDAHLASHEAMQHANKLDRALEKEMAAYRS